MGAKRTLRQLERVTSEIIDGYDDNLLEQVIEKGQLASLRRIRSEMDKQYQLMTLLINRTKVGLGRDFTAQKPDLKKMSIPLIRACAHEDEYCDNGFFRQDAEAISQMVNDARYWHQAARIYQMDSMSPLERRVSAITFRVMNFLHNFSPNSFLP